MRGATTENTDGKRIYLIIEAVDRRRPLFSCENEKGILGIPAKHFDSPVLSNNAISMQLS